MIILLIAGGRASTESDEAKQVLSDKLLARLAPEEMLKVCGSIARGALDSDLYRLRNLR